MTDFSTWYNSVPQFTRYWLTGTVAISILARFGILPPWYLILHPTFIWNLQIWRLATALFFYPLTPQTGFHFMLNCYFLYNYSLRLESGHFNNKPADYLFLLLFNWICCCIMGLVFNLAVLMDPMVLSVLYIWCQLNKDVIISFWFGTQFKAIYLPWVLCGVNVIFSAGGLDSFLGILIGHVYFFLKFKYPQDLGGQSFLETPQFLKSFYPDVTGYGFGVPPSVQRGNQPNERQGNRFFADAWGRGQNLGTD